METAGKTAQINVRLEQPLRQAGNDALTSVGLSPSAAIRALWEKAARRGKDLEEVRVLLDGSLEPSRAAQGVPEKLANLEAARANVLDALQNLGVSVSIAPSDDHVSDESVLADALMARLEERGLA